MEEALEDVNRLAAAPIPPRPTCIPHAGRKGPEQTVRAPFSDRRTLEDVFQILDPVGHGLVAGSPLQIGGVFQGCRKGLLYLSSATLRRR